MPWANKEKQREYNQRKWRENIEAGRKRNKKTYKKYRPVMIEDKYGLSPEQHKLLTIKQLGLCALCGVKQKEKLCIDHNHVTGKVRGLLCRKCNFALGLVNDDILVLQKMIKYLRQ